MIAAEYTIAGYMIQASIHRDLGSEPLSEGEAKVFSGEALIDTGASSVFIEQSVAAALNLKQVNSSEIQTAGGKVGVLVYSGVLEVPALGFKERMLLQAPKAKICYSIVLGRSFLSRYHIFIDGPKNVLTFSQPPEGLRLVEAEHDG